MKIRNGFVSNSSSSSFCIFGVCFSGEKANEIEALESNAEFNMQLKDFGLELIYGDPNGYESSVYIGKSWDRIGNDETGQQFKNSIAENVKVLLSDESIECSSHEDAWTDN